MPSALVTGATSGLGAEFAGQLAEHGYDLVLVARDSERLDTTCAALRAARGVSVDPLPADLGTGDGCARVAARLQDTARPIDLLINNAGIGTYRPFGTAPVTDEERQLDLNVRAVLRLTHAAVPGMRERGHGRIINVSSVSAFAPRAGNATYAASKAWVLMFSEGLALQLANTGVTVTAVCPGFTHTEFHRRAGADMSAVPEWMWLDAAAVVRAGLTDAQRGRAISVPAARYKVLTTAARLVPRGVLRQIMRRRGY
jgi:short-subunit dehydrogenase